MVRLIPVVFIAFISLFAVLCRFAVAASGPPGLQTVSKVDIPRYMGLWYEIARLEHRFQKNCIGSSAEYALRADGEIDVVNRCIDE